MNNPNSIAVQEEVKASQGTSGRKFGPPTPANVLSFLYGRAENLDVDELKFLSGASESARFMASQLSQTVSNVGCLIDNDFTPGKIRSGSFEDGNNVAQLMYTIADQINIISELIFIGTECDFSLRQMGVKSV